MDEGRWAAFVGDVRAAVGAWQRVPWLPAISACIVLTMFALNTAVVPEPTDTGQAVVSLGAWIAVVLAAWVYAGWVGVERLAYLAAWRDVELGPAQVAQALWSYSRRYVALALWAGLAFAVLTIPVAILQARGTVGPLVAFSIVASLVWEITLTFVTPSLAYREHGARDALRDGFGVLRRRWREAPWHALAPPLLLLAVGRVAPQRAVGAIITVAWVRVALTAKGAIAAFWLRHETVNPNALPIDGPTATRLCTPQAANQGAAAPVDVRGGDDPGVVVPAVRLNGLTRRFGGRTAVSGLTLEIAQGSFFGVLGPNGAGKTTTLRMVCGLLRPTAGTVEVLGLDPFVSGDQVKASIGVLPEDLVLFERLTGSELLRYHGALRGMPRDVTEQRARELLRVLGLDRQAGQLVADYSHGMRKKIGLAAAVLHGPRLLLLDEPFEAIDPVSARTIREVLERFTDGGGTVVLSSHVLEVVEKLCDRIAILDQGRLVAAGTVAEVAAGSTLEDAFVAIVGDAAPMEDRLSWL